MSERETMHLRLVFTRPEAVDKTAAKSTPSRGHQLAFPYPEASTVVFLDVTAIGRDEFARIIGDYSPGWIIDVRVVPRLDTLALSRRSAFMLFDRSRAHYVDLFGRLGIKSYRAVESNPVFWGSAIYDLLKQSNRKGPYLLMFDNEQLMASADHVLPGIIKPAIGKAAQFARLDRAATDLRPAVD
ncbi:MAG: hypothetical protein ACR65Z_06995 [Methylocystis sp.]